MEDNICKQELPDENCYDQEVSLDRNQDLLGNYQNNILPDNAEKSSIKKESQDCDLEPKFEEDLVLKSEFLNQINGDNGAPIMSSSHKHQVLHRNKYLSREMVSTACHSGQVPPHRNQVVNQEVLDDYYRRQQEIEDEQRSREDLETDPLS